MALHPATVRRDGRYRSKWLTLDRSTLRDKAEVIRKGGRATVHNGWIDVPVSLRNVPLCAIALIEARLASPNYFSRDLTIGAEAMILKSVLKYSDVVDSCFRALAEPTRRAIVERLSHGPATVSALAEPFHTTFAAVVQHLQVLEECGLIRSEKVGRVRTCRVESGGLTPLADWIAERRTLAERRLDRLGRLLAEDDQSLQKSVRNRKEKKK